MQQSIHIPERVPQVPGSDPAYNTALPTQTVAGTSATVNVGVSPPNTSAHTFISQELMQLDTIQEQRL